MLRKHIKTGPGGMGCPCCFPRPGSKARRYLIKQARRREARDDFNNQQTEKVPT